MKMPALLIIGLCLMACTRGQSVSEAPEKASSVEGHSTSTLAPTAVLIPDSFLGHWDASIETCRAPGDMKLVITQTEMTFWESAGQINAVTVNGPDDVMVKAAFSGEGEQWQRDLHLVLKDDTLITDGTVRVRCP